MDVFRGPYAAQANRESQKSGDLQEALNLSKPKIKVQITKPKIKVQSKCKVILEAKIQVSTTLEHGKRRCLEFTKN